MKKKDKKEVIEPKVKSKKKSDKIFYICLVLVCFLAFTGVGLYVYFNYKVEDELVIDGRTINNDTIYSEIETKVGFLSKYYIKDGEVKYFIKDLYGEGNVTKLSDNEMSLISINSTSVQEMDFAVEKAVAINNAIPNSILVPGNIPYRPFDVYKALGKVLFDTKLEKKDISSECIDYHYFKELDGYFNVNKCSNSDEVSYSFVNISKFEIEGGFVYAYVEQGILKPNSNKTYDLYVSGKDKPVITGIDSDKAKDYSVGKKDIDKLNKYKFTFEDMGEYTYKFVKEEKI